MFDYTTTTKTCVHYSKKITILNRGTTITENSEIFILKKLKLWVGWTKMMAAICILYNRNYLVKLYDSRNEIVSLFKKNVSDVTDLSLLYQILLYINQNTSTETFNTIFYQVTEMLILY